MQNMVPSQWLYDFLKKYETLRLVAYKPTPNDVWTIGWGHTEGVKAGDVCTVAQAIEWLQDDVAMRAVLWVNRLVTVKMTQNQFDALCSLVFNCGITPLQRHLGQLLNAGDYAACAQDFLAYDTQKGVVLEGLENRREAEKAHFLLAA